jgi:glycosyltransferase involved in cell wall biosynthesis
MHSTNRNYKIAIIHDWLVTYGGAERVLAAILDIYPNADLFSIVDFLPDSDRQKILGKRATTSFIQRLPFAKKKYRNYLPLMPLAIEQFDLSAYDIIISSSHAVAKGVITSQNQLHVCYCHSPIRYAWDMQHQYLQESNLTSGLKGWIARILLFNIRNWDYRTSNGVDFFIANSHYISKRIMKIYRRNSTIIHPNVDTTDFPLQTEKQDFYLTASRMVPYKKIDLIAKAFSKMPDKKLIIIGDGPQLSKVKSICAPNIIVLGFQRFETLRDYMQRAKAFVFAAEEDFGIIPVEAQSCGTPVIAYGKGGAVETVRNGETGIFFEAQDEESIISAVHDFEGADLFAPSAIHEHAQRFSSDQFKVAFSNFIMEKTKHFFNEQQRN